MYAYAQTSRLGGIYVPKRGGGRRFLGATVEQAITTGGASVGAGAATAALVGTSVVTGLATAGIGAGIGIILALFAAHQARVAGAKSENAAVGIAVPNAQSELQQIASLYNSGQLTQQQALTYVAQVAQNFQAAVAPYQTGAGQHAIACSASGSTPCNKSCTASCCVYCNNILQWVQALSAALTAGSGTAQMSQVYGSPQYGYSGQSAWSVTITPPAPASVAGVTSSLSTLASDITGGSASSSVAGIPVWMLALAGAGLLWAVL